MSCAGRHQLQGASLRNDLIAEDPNTRLMDPETKVTVWDPFYLPHLPNLLQFLNPMMFSCRSFTLDHGHRKKRSFCFANKLLMHLSRYDVNSYESVNHICKQKCLVLSFSFTTSV